MPAAGKSAKAAAMEYLVRRARSSHELRERLATAGYSDEETDGAVAALTEQGLIDDNKLARDFADFRLRNGKGEIAIRRDLEARGVDTAFIDAAIASLDDGDVRAAALKLAMKARARLSDDDALALQKAIRYVMSRGFTFPQASAAARDCFAKENI